MLDPDRAWLSQRRYADLDPRAEQALREAGLRFSQGSSAEYYLRRAANIAPEHEAVLIAQYRYHLYKHHFAEAAPFARACVALSARRLGLDQDPLRVRAGDLDFEIDEAGVRFWLFACQAYAYVLMRADHRAAGAALLEHILTVDPQNVSRTAELVATIKRAEVCDDDDD